MEDNKKRDFLAVEKDTTARLVERKWTNKCDPTNDGHEVSFRIMHWNLLAQRTCDGFDLIRDDSPILTYDNRLRLYKEHF